MHSTTDARRRWTRLAALLAAVGLVASLVVSQTATAQPSAEKATEKRKRPNVVFVLTDDLSMNLLKTMSQVKAMRKNGTSFDNHYVADGLCCPSRANILTGKYPHNTGVRVNESNRKDATGGYKAFVKKGNQKRTYATAMPKGYYTGYMGKYLNGYTVNMKKPKGWNEWHVSGNGYSEIAGTYSMTEVVPGKKKQKTRPSRYLTKELERRAKGFVKRAGNKPFFLQLSTFAPHSRLRAKKPGEPRFPAAPEDRPKTKNNPKGEFKHGDCGLGRNGGCMKLDVQDRKKNSKLDRKLRDRARMVQSVNDMIKTLRAKLHRKNTYFVFSSDNGFHLGEHGLTTGKGTAYDHDTNVPLVVEGPGVPKGKVRHELTQTVDLYPTFQRIVGKRPRPSNGKGLRTLIKGNDPKNWRDAVLFEHTRQLCKQKSDKDPDQADYEDDAKDKNCRDPQFRTYKGMRTKKWLYVRYAGKYRNALYDLRADPGQTKNVIKAHPKLVGKYNKRLKQYARCGTGKKGAATC